MCFLFFKKKRPKERMYVKLPQHLCRKPVRSQLSAPRCPHPLKPVGETMLFEVTVGCINSTIKIRKLLEKGVCPSHHTKAGKHYNPCTHIIDSCCTFPRAPPIPLSARRHRTSTTREVRRQSTQHPPTTVHVYTL